MDNDRNIPQEIKERLDIVEVIGRYVPLKNTGKNFSGVCPFHNEKTPSFMVSPELQRFKCFGCGKSGDVLNFVQDIESLDFPEVLEKLAKEAGIEYTRGKVNTFVLKLEEANTIAKDFFKESLKRSEVAKRYLEQRGFTKETIEQFDIGYAPSYNALYKHIQTKKFDKNVLEQCGLFTLKQGSIRDKFVNRIMFPLKSSYGKVVGFSGRNLPGDDFGPKYLNSPETPIFKKREMLFNFYDAKASVKKNDLCIMCEGQIDVISAFSAGITNVVAPLGTGLTDRQLELIKKYTSRILFIFDKDQAGQRALERAFILANKYSFISYASNPSPYQDLDELIQKEPKLLKEKITPKSECYSYLLISELEKTDVTSLNGTSKIINFHKKLTENVTDERFMKYYDDKLKKLSGIIIGEIPNNRNTHVTKTPPKKGLDTAEKRPSKNGVGFTKNEGRFYGATEHGNANPIAKITNVERERYLLRLAMKASLISTLYRFDERYFFDNEISELLRHIKENKIESVKDLVNSSSTNDTINNTLEDLLLQQDDIMTSSDPTKELYSIYYQVQLNYYKKRSNALQQRISQAEELKDDEKIEKYSTEFMEIILKMKDINDKISKL